MSHQLQTPLHRKILIEKSYFLVNFVQQGFAKAEVLPKCGKIKVCKKKKKIDIEVDIFNFRRHVKLVFARRLTEDPRGEDAPLTA